MVQAALCIDLPRGRLAPTEAVKRHDRVIRLTCLPLAHNGVQLDDLVQEGRLAILIALDRWEPEKGDLWTYARRWVWHAVLRFALKERREPSSPGVEEIDDDRSVEPAAESEIAARELASIAADCLTVDEARVLALRFGEDRDLRSVAAALGLGLRRTHAAGASGEAKLRARVLP